MCWNVVLAYSKKANLSNLLNCKQQVRGLSAQLRSRGVVHLRYLCGTSRMLKPPRSGESTHHRRHIAFQIIQNRSWTLNRICIPRTATLQLWPPEIAELNETSLPRKRLLSIVASDLLGLVSRFIEYLNLII